MFAVPGMPVCLSNHTLLSWLGRSPSGTQSFPHPRDERSARRVAVGFESQEDVVDGPDLRGVVRGVWVGHEVASRAEDLHTVLSHRAQVFVARDQMDFRTSPVQCRTPVGADRSGTDDCNSHGDPLTVDMYVQPRPASRPCAHSLNLVAYSMRSHLLWQRSPPGRWRRTRSDFLPGHSQEEEK